MRHTISFKHALAGIHYVFRSQPNFRFHALATIIVVLLGLWIGLTETEWTIIVFTIVMVFSAEMVNTALESITDLITQEKRLEAKIAKDVAAGMVLVAASGAIGIGILIFLPKLFSI